MPYSITTKDGITLQGIPDDVQPDSPQLKERVAKIRAGSQQITSPEAPSGLMKGLNDVAAGGGQLLAHALPESVVSGVNKATKFVNELPGIGPVTQMLGMTPATPQELDTQIQQTGQNYSQARAAAGKTGIDWGRGVGQAVGAAPLAAVGMPMLPAATTALGRAGIGFASGAMGGAMQPVETGSEDYALNKAKQTVVGGVAGAVLAPALGFVADKAALGLSKLATKEGTYMVPMERIESAIQKTLQEQGQKWEDLSPIVQNQMRVQVRRALESTGGLADPVAAARSSDFATEGMKPTLGQVLRDPGQYATERNLRTLPGVGDPLLERFQQQGRQLQEKIGVFSQGASSDKVAAGEKIADALSKFDAAKSQEVTKAYQAARLAAGKDAEVPLQGLAQDFADIVDRYRTAVPSGIRGQFAKYGLDPSEVVNQRRLFTVEEADKLLKEINKQGSNEPAVQSALSELRNAVKKAVTQDAGVDDVFAPARKAAAERFALHDAVPALEAAAKGTTAPDDFVRRFVINGKAKDVQQLAKVLKDSSPEALDQARAQIGLKLQRAAFGQDVAGDAPFNPKAYAKALSEMSDTKLGAFFSSKEIDQMHRLSRIGAYINQIPGASPVNNSNNWGAIMELASRIPGVPMAANIAKAVGTSVGNQRAVSKALAAEIPTQPNAEINSVLARYLAAASVGAGAAANQK